jgi:MFS family permease
LHLGRSTHKIHQPSHDRNRFDQRWTESVGIVHLAGDEEPPVVLSDEVWGRNNRSIDIGIMFAFYPLGYLFSILVFRLVTPIWGWRAVYLFSLVPALIILALRFRLEESPRFNAVLSELRRTQPTSSAYDGLAPTT